MQEQRRPVLAAIGSGGVLAPEVAALGIELGHKAVGAGWRVVTGGLGGVMTAVSRGARQAPGWRDGDVIGVLPGYDRGAANPYVDIVIPTGMQLGRNILVVAMADVVVALAGGAGTLCEMAAAWQLGKPLVALRPTGGWAEALAGRPLDERSAQPIISADSVDEALAIAAALRQRGGPEPGDIGSGWRQRGA